MIWGVEEAISNYKVWPPSLLRVSKNIECVSMVAQLSRRTRVLIPYLVGNTLVWTGVRVMNRMRESDNMN